MLRYEGRRRRRRRRRREMTKRRKRRRRRREMTKRRKRRRRRTSTRTRRRVRRRKKRQEEQGEEQEQNEKENDVMTNAIIDRCTHMETLEVAGVDAIDYSCVKLMAFQKKTWLRVGESCARLKPGYADVSAHNPPQ